ncbi:MAG: DUF928 domain-containing protein [Cyanobacteria bacterium J06626_18]
MLLVSGFWIVCALYPLQAALGELSESEIGRSKDAEDIFSADGNPPDRASGGGRGTCVEQLIAIVPGSPLADCNAVDAGLESYSKSYLAQTVSQSPTIWIFVPEEFRSAPSAELVLLDEDENLLWRSSPEPFQISQDRGIIHLQIAYPLESERTYRWLFTITLDPDDFNRNPTVGGLIEHTPATGDLLELIESIQARPDQIDAIYTQHGIWHDALTLSGEQLSLDPNNEAFRNAWSTLLASVGLSELADVPIANCCSNAPL